MKDTITHFLAAGTGFIITAVLMIAFTIPDREREAAARVQRDAAKAGVATYIVAEDGNPQFVWRACVGLETRKEEKGK